MTKPNLVGITFDENKFPALKTNTNQTNKLPPAPQKEMTTETRGSSSLASVTTALAYDYKKELEHISNEIETTLKKQFKDIFAQLEHKLD